MSILLICPPRETAYGPPAFPRLGLAYLSGALYAHQLEHDIVDLGLHLSDWQNELEGRITNHSIFGITSTTFEFSAAGAVAAYIKARVPDAVIILGGPHATLAGEEILSNQDEFDFILKGEGENVLPEFVRLASDGAHDEIGKLPGIHYRCSREIKGQPVAWINDLDRLAKPRYEKFDLEKYAQAPDSMQLLTSRGCPFGCIYCSVGIVMGRKFRSRSAADIFAEIKSLTTDHGTSAFTFNDDNLTFDIARAKALFSLIIDKGLDVRWNASNGIRVDYLDEELVGLMKESGCEEVAIGIESTDDRILKNLKKGTDLNKIEQAIALLNRFEIPLKGFFLVGSPGETRRDVLDSLEFAKNHLKNARFSMLTPYPGTALWQWVSENNYWTANNPIEDIVKYTHIGDGKTCYATPAFPKTEKESTYREVYRQWDEFSHAQSVIGKIKYRIRSCPGLFRLAKWSYQNLKKTLKIFSQPA